MGVSGAKNGAAAASTRLGVVLAAAGQGRRLGAGPPKQHVLLGGQPLLVRTVAALEACPEVDSIVVVVEEEGLGQWRALLLEPNHPKIIDVVSGGGTRAHSVRRGLLRLVESASFELVAVHDGARPLVSCDLVRALVRRMGEEPVVDGVCPALPLTDTIKEINGRGLVTQGLDRSRLVSVQTPQVFRRDILLSAYQQPDGVLALVTDDAALVERVGGRVGTVSGQWDNLKITTPFDLRVAELLLKERQEYGPV